MRRSTLDARVRARPRARLAGRADALDLLAAWPGSWRASSGRVVTAIRSMSLTLSASAAPSRRAARAFPRRRARVRPAASASPISSARGSSSARLRALAGAFGERREHASPRTSGPSPRTVRRRCASGRLAQRLQRVDAELGVQQPRALGPEAGQARDRDQPGRELARAAARPPGSCRSRRSARIFSCSVAPIPGSSLARPSRASAATDTEASRTPCAPPCGRPARGARSRRRARTGRRAPPARRRSRRWTARRGHAVSLGERRSRAARRTPHALGYADSCPASPG